MFRVALFNKRVIGYICLRTFVDVTDIMNLAVTREFRRKGVGSLLLLDSLRENSRAHPGIRRYLLEVRASNIAAINLYKKFGFFVVDRRRGYYSRPDEDAVVMEKVIGPSREKMTG
jgi:ribosomal-protein-alanine N-acetyltransferase